MYKTISKSDDPGFFAKGGKTHMFEKGTAHDAEEGVSGKQSNGGKGQKWAEGGHGKMFGKGHAGQKEPGYSGKCSQVG